MTPQEKLREEFRKWCNTDNLSDPPSETTEIFDWFLARMIPVEVVREKVIEIQDEYKGDEEAFNNGLKAMKGDVLNLLASLETLQANK